MIKRLVNLCFLLTRTLLIASLQFFASLCLHRDQNVLEHLNIATLGRGPVPPQLPANAADMNSLKPVVLPRNEVQLIYFLLSLG